MPHGWHLDAGGNLVRGRHTDAPPTAPAPVTRRFLGLDLGKMVDHTAFVMLEWTWPPPHSPQPRPVYDVPALRRWPLGTSYAEIADWLVSLHHSPAAAPRQAPPACWRPCWSWTKPAWGRPSSR
jgi:hypothetical protein